MMLILLFLFSLFQVGVRSTCYNPDGSVQNDEAYKPCIAIEGAKTMCCALNRTNPSGGLFSEGWTADQCMGNGLRANLANQTSDGETYVVTTTYWRDLCWTSDWNSTGNCLNFCMGAETSRMTPCDGTGNSTTWCCGTDTDCCGTDSAVDISQYFGDYSPSSASSTSTSDHTSTSSSSSAGTSSTSQGTSSPTKGTSSTAPTTSTTKGASSDGKGMSSAEKVAVGLGVALGVTIVASGLAIFFLWRQKNQLTQSTYDSQLGVQFHRKAQGTHELHSVTTTSEVERPHSHILELAGAGPR